MKIGKIELLDWKYQHHNVGTPAEWYGWYRNTGLKDDNAIAFHSSPKSTGWTLYFGGNLSFIRKLCYDRIIIVSEDEAKEYMDKLIFRVSKLIAFI